MENQPNPPSFPEAPKEPAEVQPSKQSNAGLWTLILGSLFAISPIFLASISTPSGGNMYDESSGGGAALWFLMVTIPVGGIVALIGLGMLIVSGSTK